MQFTTTILVAATALISAVSAKDGIFAIEGAGIAAQPAAVYLKVSNGLVGDPAKCQGRVEVPKLPGSGSIPCDKGYSLTWKWDTKLGAIAATYGTPSSAPFTYNVPNKGCNGDKCEFGFRNIYPGRKMRRGMRSEAAEPVEEIAE